MNEAVNIKKLPNPSLNIADVNGSVFFQIGKYYKNILNDNSIQYFKCTKIINFHGEDAYGFNFRITPGENIFKAEYTAFFSNKEWQEISKEEFIISIKKYIKKLQSVLK